MRIFRATALVATTAFISSTCNANDLSTAALNPSTYVDGSLCTKSDKIVLSCPLANSRKIVSICAAGRVAPHQFYYAFGKPHAVEMVYPSSPSVSDVSFYHSFLFYSGGTGGYAYSFSINGFRYIFYLISGRFNYNDGGVTVQKAGDIHATNDQKCAKGKITETSDEPLLDETLKWKTDDSITGHGIPSVR